MSKIKNLKSKIDGSWAMKFWQKSLLSLFCLTIVNSALYAATLSGVVPRSDELKGFSMIEEPMYYTTDNLWDYIDGAAPSYLAYGFKEVVTFILMNDTDSTEFVVDIYDMADSLNAFGMFSIEKAPDAPAVAIGSEAFHGGNTLYFWQDHYYVKLIAYDESEQTASSLTCIGKILSRKLPQQGSMPSLFGLFPQKNRQSGSARYMARDVLGQEYLTHGYRLAYNLPNDQEYFIFLIQAANETEAQSNLTRYHDYIKKVGEVTDEEVALGDSAFAGTENYYGSIMLVRKGKNLIGVFGQPERSAAEAIVRSMCQQL